MRYLTTQDVRRIHRRVLKQSGGSTGLRDLASLESAVAQPRMSFAGQDLYPTLAEKAAALAYSLVCNHPFVDGNKRAGHAAMETFLMLNGHEISAPVAEQEKTFLDLAAGALSRAEFVTWVEGHVVPLPPSDVD